MFRSPARLPATPVESAGPRPVFRRLALMLLALMLVTVTSSACGGGGRRHHVYGGTLEVVNHPASFEIIDVIDISQPFGPIESYAVFLLPGETFEIDLYPDTYDVDVYWSDGFVEGATVDIWDDLVTTVVFQN